MPENEAKQTLHLPLLIARALVVFPSLSEEIEAARPFSIKAIEAARKDTNNLMFVVSQIDSESDDASEKNIYRFGTLVRIVNYSASSDCVRVRVIGSKRIRFASFDFTGEAFYADGTIESTYLTDADERRNMITKILDIISGSRELSQRLTHGAMTQLSKTSTDIDEVPDTLAAYLPISMQERQGALEALNVNDRLNLLMNYVSSFKKAREVDQEIEKKVRESADKAQKDYLLRERMKAIKEELGEDPNDERSESSIREKLKKNPYPQNVKDKVERELKRYSMMPESSLESSLIMSYIETLLDVPWFEKTEDNEDLENVRRVLDEDHY
ncbi:MAG: LON peptidase substrate-binding domain-containing protein, partial [Bacilli bacterium]|nr:LON peptidase substrate-binding domain-containing protein [Bacilli bacterium]